MASHFHSFAKDHEDRTAYTEFDVEQLMAQMETDKAKEIEITGDTTMAEAADPTSQSKKRSGSEADVPQVRYEDLDWKKKKWTTEEWECYEAHKKQHKDSQASSSSGPQQTGSQQEYGQYGPHRTQKTSEQVRSAAAGNAMAAAAKYAEDKAQRAKAASQSGAIVHT